jgi:exopolysaccharide biosynthesis polyprenyl glycosylphosphotransferase
MKKFKWGGYKMVEAEEKYKNNSIYFSLKRFIDIVFSLFALIIFSPLLILIAEAIKLDSEGPVFFEQERVGLNGKHFKMYKFRSMCADAEEKLEGLREKNEMSGPMFKMSKDPRITRVGAFLRKTSLDEIPQLFNIIKGDMSLVGPRPNLPREVEKFTEEQKRKLIAKPGLTCYWQIMGRNSIDFEDWMKLDIKYVEERNTWVDIKLIFMTVSVLFGDDGAK